jgi:hypothetical protein
MKFRQGSIDRIAGLICGNRDEKGGEYFVYRSSSYLTRFFQDCETDYEHSSNVTRKWWVAGVLQEILNEPQQSATTPPDTFRRVIETLMDQGDAEGEGPDRPKALETLNAALVREGFEAFYGPDKKCYLRHIATNAVVAPNPHRPFTKAEQERRDRLAAYLDKCSEDQLIMEVLLPLFRQLGFLRITAAGHKDKALEYGKDVWMKYTLPTTHVLYFGIQVKKGKLDAAGMTKDGNANIAEIYNQVLMMIGHEIFDLETGRTGLVDHAFIVAGGEITKQAKNWLGAKLDSVKRSQIMFMDRDDILNLFAVTGLAVPGEKKEEEDDDIPF